MLLCLSMKTTLRSISIAYFVRTFFRLPFLQIFTDFFILSINATLAVSKNKEQEGKISRHVGILALLKE